MIMSLKLRVHARKIKFEPKIKFRHDICFIFCGFLPVSTDLNINYFHFDSDSNSQSYDLLSSDTVLIVVLNGWQQ